MSTSTYFCSGRFVTDLVKSVRSNAILDPLWIESTSSWSWHMIERNLIEFFKAVLSVVRNKTRIRSLSVKEACPTNSFAQEGSSFKAGISSPLHPHPGEAKWEGKSISIK